MDIVITCKSCGYDCDTVNKLPHVLDCRHMICTDCLKTILLGEKKCNECHKEIKYNSVGEVQFSIPVIRAARIREIECHVTTPSKDEDNHGIGDHSKNQEGTKRRRKIKDEDEEPKSVMEENSIGDCDTHFFPVVGYCKTCDHMVCKDCLIFDHYKSDCDKTCDVVSMVVMAKSFIYDCTALTYKRLCIIEFHRFRMQAFRFYLDIKKSELDGHMNEDLLKEYREMRIMVVEAQEYLHDLMVSVHFYKISLGKLTCTEKLSFDMREISYSIDSMPTRLYPVEIFAEKFFKKYPDFSYKVLLTHGSDKVISKLIENFSFLTNTDPSTLDSTDLEENLIKFMETTPKLKAIGSSLAYEFANTMSEIRLTTSYNEIVKYNHCVMAKLALMPGEVIIQCGRNIWINDHPTARGNKSSEKRLLASQIEKNIKSQQESGNLTGARPKTFPGQSSRSNSQGIQPQEPILSLKQENLSQKTNRSNLVDSCTNERLDKTHAKSQQKSQTTSHHSTDYAKKASKYPMSTLTKIQADYFFSLITFLTPSIAYIIATTPLNLPPVNLDDVKIFGYYSLGKLAESIKSNAEVDINSFNEKKLLHEKRSKCHEEVKLFRSNLNPFAIFNNDAFPYSAHTPPSQEHHKRSRDAVLTESCQSQKEPESSVGETVEIQGENEDTPKEPQRDNRKPGAIQWESEENQSQSESSQRENEENQIERRAKQNTQTSNMENEESQKQCKANQKKHEASQIEKKESQKKNEKSQREKQPSQREKSETRREHEPSQIVHEATHRADDTSQREIETGNRENKKSQEKCEDNQRELEANLKEIHMEYDKGWKECGASQMENRASHMEHEARKWEHEARQREHEASQREHEASQREHEASQREHEASQREHEASQREHEASQREHEVSHTEPGFERGEPGVGRGEPGVGRGEPGVGRGELGVGRSEPGVGRGEPGVGRGEPGVGRGEPGVGRGEPGVGRGETGAGRGEPGVGRGEPGAGRGEPGSGRGEPGSDELGHGEPESGWGEHLISKGEHQASPRKHEASQKKYEVRQREYEARQKEYETRQREHETGQKEHEARQREHETRQREHETRQRKYEESLRGYEESLGSYEESHSKYEENKKEYESSGGERESSWGEHEKSQRQQQASPREHEASQKEYEARQREHEASQKEYEARQRKHEARQREHETRQREYDERLRKHEEILTAYEESLASYEASQSKYEDKEKEYEAFRRLHKTRQMEHIAIQRELVAIHREWGAIQIKYKADPMFLHRNSAKITHEYKTQTMITKETSNLTGTPVSSSSILAIEMGAAALPLNTLRVNLQEEMNQNLTLANSDKILALETRHLHPTQQSENQTDTDEPQDNSNIDELHFKTQDKFTVKSSRPTGTPEYSCMPIIQIQTEALPRISNTATPEIQTQNTVQKQDQGGSVLKTQSKKKTGFSVFKNSLALAQQFCTQHNFDSSYIPFVTNIFTKLAPSATETVLYIIEYMEENRVPPMLPATSNSSVPSSDDEDLQRPWQD
ncbi:uncharacterized protein [Palaemon carinicauda]|uniref:uncharacterized protein n=1 Tax=Palaemon carinicauda TaxID=392227 RepID=UPI0035B6A905